MLLRRRGRRSDPKKLRGSLTTTIPPKNGRENPSSAAIGDLHRLKRPLEVGRERAECGCLPPCGEPPGDPRVVSLATMRAPLDLRDGTDVGPVGFECIACPRDYKIAPSELRVSTLPSTPAARSRSETSSKPSTNLGDPEQDCREEFVHCSRGAACSALKGLAQT